MTRQRPVMAALGSLIVLQLIMLMALYTKTTPHPPISIPLFGIAPFLGASIAACVSAIVLLPTETRSGRIFSVLSALLALLSFGPQKYFDAQFSLIWPAVIAGQLAAVVVLYEIARAGLHKGTASLVGHSARKTD